MIVASLAACSINSAPADGADNPGNATTGGSTAAGDAGAGTVTVTAKPGPVPFKPSNGIDLSTLDLSRATGEVSLTGECKIDSEALSVQCGYGSALPGIATKVVTLADQTRVAVFAAKSFRIETSTTVRTEGAIPIVFAALDTIAVLGTLRVIPGTAGGARTTSSYERGGGQGGGTSATRAGASGGGASFCGIGGKAASPGPAVSEPPPAYGSPSLIPLVGGSAGAAGSGRIEDYSHGGGALQLIAGTSIFVAPSGAVSAGGAGGNKGSIDLWGAAGGGSGGALLLEAPTVSVAGTLAANGGGGGDSGNSGAEAPGENGKGEDIAAAGGTGPERGGAGSAAASLNGGDATWTTPNGPYGNVASSGGGGGAGRIRINTSTGAATITGVISPSLTTPCATQGSFAP